MDRTASAVWNGDLKSGSGVFSTGSTAISGLKYSFRTRFEDEPGTNPEELIAAAHASCFSMALSAKLGGKGITPEAIETTCAITFSDGVLSKSTLTTKVTAPGADEAAVREAADDAKATCPISKVLNLEVVLNLSLA